MKNLVIMGLLALLMFSVSAALSMWLRESRRDAETAASEKSEKSDKPGKKQPPDTEKGREPTEPKIDRSMNNEPAGMTVIRDRELKVERRSAQIELITRDLESQREVVDNLVRQVSTELKNRPSELESRPDLDKKKAEFEATERKNIERMAAMYDAMAPDKAAGVLKQLADSGRMDTAVRVLAQMKERSAARVLDELGDASLAAQLFEKLRVLKAGSPQKPAGGAEPVPETQGNPGR